jgi:hypothetical protein
MFTVGLELLLYRHSRFNEARLRLYNKCPRWLRYVIPNVEEPDAMEPVRRQSWTIIALFWGVGAIVGSSIVLVTGVAR